MTQPFLQSYLLGYLFWLAPALGSLSLIMIHNLTGGAWGKGLRPYLESAARTIPVFAVLFLPIAFGLQHLYLWADPAVAASDPIIRGKSMYLNVPFFLGRAVFYFVSWSALSYFLDRWSREYAQNGDAASHGKLQAISGFGLVFFGLTGTFAAFDWAESLEPHWHSTIYGLIFMAGQALAALALAVGLAGREAQEKPWRISVQQLHDFGNLLLAFVMIWTYLSLGQLIIIWYGNIPEEIPWYIRRSNGGWLQLSIFIAAAHFAFPFFLLLMRAVKRNARALTLVAALIFAMRLPDLIWQILPVFRERAGIRLTDAAAVIGIGIVWYFLLNLQLKRQTAWEKAPSDHPEKAHS